MRTKIISISVLVMLLALGVGFRLLQLKPYPKGESNWVESPNQRHRAYVCAFTDMGFFSGERQIYRLKVEIGIAGGKRMPVFEQDVLQNETRGPVDLNRLDDLVVWAPDSAFVVFRVAQEDIRADVPF